MVKIITFFQGWLQAMANHFGAIPPFDFVPRADADREVDECLVAALDVSLYP